MPDVHEVVRKICLHFSETEEVESHGAPEFKVRGKSFATFSLNHHGDGRVALIVNGSPETQAMLVESAPKIFFVPPYVGHKGWYGIDLAQGMRWDRVAELVRDAYIRVAPRSLGDQAEAPTNVPDPDTVDIEKLDPFFAPENQALLEQVRQICMALPEVVESTSFGTPVFKAGKKTFCHFHCRRGVPVVLFWVGPERQASLTLDPRFEIPAYMGHNGWISLRLDRRFDTGEVEGLALESYRHYALKRMLKALDANRCA